MSTFTDLSMVGHRPYAAVSNLCVTVQIWPWVHFKACTYVRQLHECIWITCWMKVIDCICLCTCCFNLSSLTAYGLFLYTLRSTAGLPVHSLFAMAQFRSLTSKDLNYGDKKPVTSHSWHWANNALVCDKKWINLTSTWRLFQRAC